MKTAHLSLNIIGNGSSIDAGLFPALISKAQAIANKPILKCTLVAAYFLYIVLIDQTDRVVL